MRSCGGVPGEKALRALQGFGFFVRAAPQPCAMCGHEWATGRVCECVLSRRREAHRFATNPASACVALTQERIRAHMRMPRPNSSSLCAAAGGWFSAAKAGGRAALAHTHTTHKPQTPHFRHKHAHLARPGWLAPHSVCVCVREGCERQRPGRGRVSQGEIRARLMGLSSSNRKFFMDFSRGRLRECIHTRNRVTRFQKSYQSHSTFSTLSSTFSSL